MHYAQKDHPEASFVCQDMLSFLQQQKQESWDVVIACASFQHLPTQKERKSLMSAAYRALKYDGYLMMTNWAFSDWFLKKHWKVILKSAFYFVFSLGQRSWRDAMIPWKSQGEIAYRYYHLFSLEELTHLLKIA